MSEQVAVKPESSISVAVNVETLVSELFKKKLILFFFKGILNYFF